MESLAYVYWSRPKRLFRSVSSTSAYLLCWMQTLFCPPSNQLSSMTRFRILATFWTTISAAPA